MKILECGIMLGEETDYSPAFVKRCEEETSRGQLRPSGWDQFRPSVGE